MSARPFIAPALLTLVFGLACTGGASLDGNNAGSDGWLDDSPVAPANEPVGLSTDGRCDWLGRPYVGATQERLYSLVYSNLQHDCATGVEVERKTLHAVSGSTSSALVDVTGHADVRLLDTEAGLLLMGESNGNESLWLIDHEDLEILGERQLAARYHGTRTSPSRRWVAAGDNSTSDLALHVIDPVELTSHRLGEDASWAEAQWLEGEDRLAGIFFDSDTYEARLEVWDFSGATVPTAPALSTTIEDVHPNIFMTYTWISADPLGRFVAYPVNDLDTGESVVLLQDLTTGEVTSVPGVDGPLRFTPDGSGLLGWDVDNDGTLAMIDPISLAVEYIEVPIDGAIEFVMSPSGHDLLVAPLFGGGDLVLHDLDSDDSVVLPLQAALTTFTMREEEVWMIEDGELYRIDMGTEELDPVDLVGVPDHVVWMPQSDQMYVGRADVPRGYLLDPVTQEVTQQVNFNTSATPAIDLSVDTTILVEERSIATAAVLGQ